MDSLSGASGGGDGGGNGGGGGGGGEGGGGGGGEGGDDDEDNGPTQDVEVVLGESGSDGWGVGAVGMDYISGKAARKEVVGPLGRHLATALLMAAGKAPIATAGQDRTPGPWVYGKGSKPVQPRPTTVVTLQ